MVRGAFPKSWESPRLTRVLTLVAMQGAVHPERTTGWSIATVFYHFSMTDIKTSQGSQMLSSVTLIIVTKIVMNSGSKLTDIFSHAPDVIWGLLLRKVQRNSEWGKIPWKRKMSRNRRNDTNSLKISLAVIFTYGKCAETKNGKSLETDKTTKSLEYGKCSIIHPKSEQMGDKCALNMKM